MITIFTDGSSRGNPGRGGWGTVIVYGTEPHFDVTEIGGREDTTTNNRMELMAAINALKFCVEKIDPSGLLGRSIKTNCDSSYVIQGITKWVFGWARTDWITTQKKEVLNKDLWQDLMGLVVVAEKRFQTKLTWNYVGGHVGIAGNERCDVIATSFADKEPTQLFSGHMAEYQIKNILDVTVNQDAGSATHKKKRSKAQAYSYVSKVGDVIKTHSSWKDCEARVKGAAGAKFKKSLDASDEAMIIKSFS